MGRLIDVDEANRLWCKGCDACKKNMDKIPTIEPKRAEWVTTYTEQYGFRVCSECRVPAPWDYTRNQILSNYCPNCGADMRGEVNEQTDRR